MLIRPIESSAKLVNHKAPSGPAAIPSGCSDAGAGVVGDHPAVLIRPIESPAKLVNHKAPSRPAAIPSGSLMPGPV